MSSDMKVRGDDDALPLRDDQEIIAALQQQAAAMRARMEQLNTELTRITLELRRYDRAIAVLRKSAPQSKATEPRLRPKKISEERVQQTWDAIRQVAAQRDEFTQVEIRALTGDHSSSTSLAFEALRQRGQIRVARRAGPNKFFRLTHAALEAEAAKS